MPSSRLNRFAPLLAAGPLLCAGAAAALPAAARDAAALGRPALGTSGCLAATPAVPGGRQVFAPFELTNTGREPLTVTAVEPDCGCLTPLLDRELYDPKVATVIAPGGRLELIVRADTAREAEGPHEHTVTVACENPAGEPVRQSVRMRYAVGPHEIRITPPAVMVYQREGQSTTATVTVTDRRARPLRVLAVHSPTDRVHVQQADPVARADGGWDLPFEVTVIGCEGGGTEAVVAVEVDDPAGRYQTLKLPVTTLPPDRLLGAAATARKESSESSGRIVSPPDSLEALSANPSPWPNRWRRRGAGWASLLRVPVCPLGRFVDAPAERLDDPAAQHAGLTLILPGIQGRSFAEYDLALGLAAGGLPGRIAVFDWTTGWFVRAVEHLRRTELHEAGGRAVAARLAEHRRRFPGSPAWVLGYSGGAAVALRALGHLPAGVTVTRAVLLAPACSPRVDAAALAGRCDEGLDALCSRLDWAVLGALLAVLGTTDGRHVPAAGWSGFERAGPGFREHWWRPAWVRGFHHGGHFGAVNRVFAAERLAPLLRAGWVRGEG